MHHPHPGSVTSLVIPGVRTIHGPRDGVIEATVPEPLDSSQGEGLIDLPGPGAAEPHDDRVRAPGPRCSDRRETLAAHKTVTRVNLDWI